MSMYNNPPTTPTINLGNLRQRKYLGLWFISLTLCPDFLQQSQSGAFIVLLEIITHHPNTKQGNIYTNHNQKNPPIGGGFSLLIHGAKKVRICFCQTQFIQQELHRL